MGTRKVKKKVKAKRLRGHRITRNVQIWERQRMRDSLRSMARRRRMTKVDEETGETYVLARLALKKKDAVGEYKAGLDEALEKAPLTAEDQADAIRDYLQACVDNGTLIAVPCERGKSPTCKVYQGENQRVVAIRQSDPVLEDF